MRKKNSKYVINLDPQIAGAIAALCPQGTIGRSLSQFIMVQYAALERERNELICQDCVVSLPVEIADTLEWLYPNLPFSDKIINAVRTLVDLSDFNAFETKDLASFLRDEVSHYRSIADLQNYYAAGGGSGDEDASASVPLR